MNDFASLSAKVTYWSTDIKSSAPLKLINRLASPRIRALQKFGKLQLKMQNWYYFADTIPLNNTPEVFIAPSVMSLCSLTKGNNLSWAGINHESKWIHGGLIRSFGRSSFSPVPAKPYDWAGASVFVFQHVFSHAAVHPVLLAAASECFNCT